jgi:L-Ala-D/L-Glu epimerase
MTQPATLFSISASIERWPIEGAFTISRGSKREAVVVVVEVSADGIIGRGECVPYARYAETPEATLAELSALGPVADARSALASLNSKAARNALDCAIWDWQAKHSGEAPHVTAGQPAPRPILTCYTLSLDTPEAMAAKARSAANLPLLKLKLGGADDAARMRAVRASRPDARLIADANEGWQLSQLVELLAVAAEARFETIEQPLRADADAALATIDHPVPICADESAHDAKGVAALAGRYDAVNIKLDKTGGLTAALAMAEAARAANLRIMVGCMVATSLSMAPALVLAGDADWVDLDGPLLLAKDRANGLVIRDGWISPATTLLWG